jgi:PAS domain S-box-containing protein
MRVAAFANLGLRERLLGSFGLVLALLLLLSAAAFSSAVLNQQAAEWVAHTLRVINLANSALANIGEAESGYRGFLLTGQDDFLAPYVDGQQEFQADLDALLLETADNPAQVARWQDVAERMAAWTREVAEPNIALRREVATGRATLDAVIAQVGAGESRRRLAEVRGLLAAGIAVEQGFLTERTQAAAAANTQLEALLVGGTLLAAGAGVVLALLLARSVAEPMAQFAAVAGHIAGGDLDQRIRLPRRDEIGRAAAAFDAMADQLQGTIGRNDAILRTAAEGIFGLDREGRAIFANPAAARLTGYRREELLGEPVHERVHHTRADGTPYPDDECPIQRGLGDGTVAQVTDEVFWRKDGSSFFVEYTSAPVVEADEVIGGVVTFRDVTDRRRAEQALDERTRELLRSNAELEQFAYVASHDLQEPLRAIVSYLQLIERRYKGHLDERADRYIGHAVAGTRRMQVLINELLTYSRVGRRGGAFAPVDGEAIFEQAIANLRTAIAQSEARVTHDPLPTVQGDPTQLLQLFQNLIGNAIKFRAEAPPRVHVAAEHNDGAWQFAVRDNGIGIAPEYHDRVFVIFQRLHGRDEYPGTGIGLAICKKIVERHGGRIWIESRPGEGTTFRFTIPDAGGTG